MFDSLAPEVLSAADDAVVVDAVAGWARGEAAAAARRLAAIGELVERRCAPDDEDPEVVDSRARWSCDPWDAVAAEVGAALGISARRASSQMYLARSLRERLPKVNAVFLAGRIGARLVSTISWRTHLVVDEGAMAAIDAGIAREAESWGPLSYRAVENLIDALVDAHDPQARYWFEEAARGLDVQFGKPDDDTGTRSMWGRLYATHAELVERRLTAIARAVCAADPRSVGQRRAEAMGAVFAGADRIACRCGAPDCPNPTTDALRGSVVVHVVADPAAVEQAQATTTTTIPEVQSGRRPATVLARGGIVPTPLLAELIRNGAQLVGVTTPYGTVEPRYRPSVALQRFIRCRDLTCRFPGCDAPAEVCDIDHAIAHPVGGTHPANLRCLCRKHHLLRTFWIGADGWSDKQFADGTIVWTAPSGHTYTTHPGAGMYFPNWDVATAELPLTPRRPVDLVHRALRMPRRRRTREADRAQRIKNRRTHGDTS